MGVLRNGMSTSKAAVDKYLGTSFDIVKTVYDNLADIITTADAIEEGTISDTLFQIEIERQTGSQAVARLFTFATITYGVALDNINVYRNGQRLDLTDDYTEPSSTTLLLTFDPNDGDKFVFITNERTDTANIANASNVSFTPTGTGAVATTVQSKLEESISVKDFGAVGDGVIEDSVAFIAAAAMGKSIELEADKTYLLNTNIPIISKSGFFCVGGVATIKSTTLVNLNIFTGTSITDIHFENILFDMPDVGSAYTVQPIYIIGVTRFKAINCKMTDGTSLMHLFGGTDVWVDRCEADTPDSYGVIFAGSIDNLWVTNGIYNDSVVHDGIKVAGSVTAEAPTHKNIHIYGNTCKRNNRDGIDVAVNDGDNILIHGNILEDNTISAIEFKLVDTDPVALKNCKLYDNQINLTVNSSVGISAIAASATSEVLMHDIQVSDNNITCDDITTQTGIKLTNILRSSTKGNTVYQGIDAYRYLGCTEGDLTDNTADSSGNFVHLSTDGTNAPDGIRIGNNVGKNLASRFWRVIDSSTINIRAFNNISDAPIDTIDGTVWSFSNGAGGVEVKTASFSIYPTHDGSTFTNQGSAANQTFTINEVLPGLTYTFEQTDAPSLQFAVSPPAGVTIGAGGSGKDLLLNTDNGIVVLKAMTATRMEIISNNGATVTYEA